jgi:hypothetical protein
MVLLLWIIACGGDDTSSDVPACVDDVIAGLEADPVRNPPSSVTEYVIDGERYYYIPPYCCDAFSVLLDDQCDTVCNPDGGESGKGSGKCPDLDAATSTRVIWEDDRGS